MNNGRIKALDIECFINGGCTLDDSEQVCASETGTVLVCEQNAEFLSFYLFIYLFILAALGLCCCARAFSSCGERGLLFIAVRGLLIVVASLVVEHGL